MSSEGFVTFLYRAMRAPPARAGHKRCVAFGTLRKLWLDPVLLQRLWAITSPQLRGTPAAGWKSAAD